MTDSSLVLVVDSNPLVAEGLDAILSRRRGLMAVAGVVDDQGQIGPGPGAPVGVVARAAVVDPLAVDIRIPALAAANRDLWLIGYLPEERSSEARHCMTSGFRGVLAKTSGSDTIFAALQLVMQGSIYLDAPFAGAPIRQSTAPPGAMAANVVLSDREISVLKGMAQGMSAKEIGQSLQLSGKTVETYKARAASKLNLRGRREIVDYVLRSGWMTASA